MAWRKPTRDDLVATLSQVEVDAFEQSKEFQTQANVVERIIEDSAELLRGYLRRLENQGGLRIHPEDGYIPNGLMNPTMDIAAFKILKRFNLEVTNARQQAYDEAMKTLRDVAAQRHMAESYVDASDTEQENLEAVTGMVPLYGFDFNEHLLDHEKKFDPSDFAP